MVLRKLFERLGATYIKLGQFIASSPTLFPPEYVLEFEKCLDRTEPVPWEVIRATIASRAGGALSGVRLLVRGHHPSCQRLGGPGACSRCCTTATLQSYNVCCDASCFASPSGPCVGPISMATKQCLLICPLECLFPFVACGELHTVPWAL